MNKLESFARLLLPTTISILLLNSTVQAASTSAGQVRFCNNANTEFVPYMDNIGAAEQNWMNEHYYRMIVYSPYFDSKTNWYHSGLAYTDAYAIYVNDPIALTHPEWIMKDAQGNNLYIPWECANGACTQFAGDFSNPAFRQYMIQKMQATIAKGYRGLWLDDINLTWRVSNGAGTFVTPIDRNTGAPMTLDSWRLYFTEYLEQVRASLPSAELVHNVVWFSDSADARSPYIARQIKAANYVNLERGGNDAGLGYGYSQWGYESFLQYIDYVHNQGTDVLMMDIGANPKELEYGLGTWLLTNQGNDILSNNGNAKLASSTPNTWWPGYNTNLGNALNGRYQWNNLLRRDFNCGMVLVNQPGTGTQTINLNGTYKDVYGQSVNFVTLTEKQAAVLSSACTN